MASKFHFLDGIDQAVDPGIFFIDVETDFPQARQNVRSSGFVGDKDIAAVADPFRWNMFGGSGSFLDGGHVETAFMGKGGVTHIRGMTVWLAVQTFVQEMGYPLQMLEALFRDSGLKAHFEIRVGMMLTKFVPAAFAQTIERPLNLSDAGPDRGDVVGDAVVGVVVAVNAQVPPGRA